MTLYLSPSESAGSRSLDRLVRHSCVNDQSLTATPVMSVPECTSVGRQKTESTTRTGHQAFCVYGDLLLWIVVVRQKRIINRVLAACRAESFYAVPSPTLGCRATSPAKQHLAFANRATLPCQWSPPLPRRLMEQCIEQFHARTDVVERKR